MTDLWTGQNLPPVSHTPTNPMIAYFGRGPDGTRCKTCVHCRYPDGYGRRYYKCDLRRLTHGAATDHRVRWPACGRYEEKK
jgi:hypothetical protein